MAELSQAAPRAVVDTRLERVEAGYDAAHFLSLIATAEFFTLVFAYLGVAAWLIAWGGGVHSPQIIAGQIAAAIIALGVVWVMYRARTRLVLPVVGLFILAFAIAYGTALLPGNALGYSVVATVASWLAVVWYFGWLAAVLYQFGRAAWQVSRLTSSESLIVRGEAPGAVAGYLLQLFGIPGICAWLGPLQRRLSVLLFLLTTAVFCLFASGLWSSLFTYLPSVELLSRDVIGCYAVTPRPPACGSMLAIWLVAAVLFLPAALALNLAVLAGLRFAARRFTRLSLERLISSDTRPVILFLRSFRDDQVGLQKPLRRLFRRLISVGEPRPTLDHVLLEEGTPYGPVVAIGRPGSAAPFGAARTYVSDEEWRETVSGLCSHAGAVVLTLDETEGVRWELSHLFGQNYERKTLFLLPPRLAPADEAARMLPAALTHWREPSEWAAQICEVAKNERRCCIGWFWRDDGQVEVFTSLRASYLAYLLAVRTFLSRSAVRFETPPHLPTDGGEVAPSERRPYLGPYLGAGILLAIAVVAFFLFTFSPPGGAAVFAPAVFAALACWGLSRMGLPFALVPTLGLSLGQCLFELMPLASLAVAGQLTADLWPVAIQLAILVGLIAWTITAQSRPAVIVLMLYQLLMLAGSLLVFLSPQGAGVTLIGVALNLGEVGASIFALATLHPARPAQQQ
jgi:hypothetical protein